MKRYIYYFMIIGLLPVFSCTDGLDLYPNDKVTVDNYWNTAEDALRAVNATYSNIFPQSDTYGCDLLFLDAASDNTYPQHSNQFGNFQQIALNAFEANHAVLQELWKTLCRFSREYRECKYGSDFKKSLYGRGLVSTCVCLLLLDSSIWRCSMGRSSIDDTGGIFYSENR